ncbi:MAG: glycolate oxidase subunit GlcF [Rhodospirillaceae bacterium]|nr:glycolate oxidase subunit GlcF [Rhodospirillaceae bacterium]
MQTLFTTEQLTEPGLSIANDILRKCVHCGFCTATCPTYVLLGDELDSPRGRIYQFKDMLESGKPPSEKLVRHADRCLSCLSCMTTCPASVDYMHLVDEARVRIEQNYTRPLPERLLRVLLAWILPYPRRFRLALMGAWLAKPFAGLMPGRLKSLMKMAPARVEVASHMDRAQTFPAEGERRMRVALMTGCAQQVLRPSINEATIRLLTRHGCEVVIADGAGCCGALVHHMGRESDSHAAAKANIDAWHALDGADSLDAIVINASGCGTTVKDYGFMLHSDDTWAEKARWVSERTKDITEVMADLGIATSVLNDAPAVVYHSACSMQHGQQITLQPKALLETAGFDVRSPAEGHLCCGSAGTYNIMQPELAGQLRARKLGNLRATKAEIVATGNIGCLEQLSGDELHVVHTAELLDWATGGPKPPGLP